MITPRTNLSAAWLEEGAWTEGPQDCVLIFFLTLAQLVYLERRDFFPPVCLVEVAVECIALTVEFLAFFFFF